jgi:hypothetical protein
MVFLLLFFVELLILFFFSRSVTRNLSYIFYRISRSEKITIYFMAFFFFPGTLVHELAHYVTALLLFVHASHMEFIPKVLGSGVKLGSVQIARTDPIRRALIGMAPFFWGTTIILGTLTVFRQFGGLENIWITVLTGYVLFEISNTMFSSRKDMEGTLELFVALIVVFFIFYVLGFRFPSFDPNTALTPQVLELFKTGSYFLAVPLGIDIALLVALRILLRSFDR